MCIVHCRCGLGAWDRDVMESRRFMDRDNELGIIVVSAMDATLANPFPFKTLNHVFSIVGLRGCLSRRGDKNG